MGRKEAKQKKTKVLIKLHGCAGWSTHLFFAFEKSVFSRRDPFDIAITRTTLVKRSTLDSREYCCVNGRATAFNTNEYHVCIKRAKAGLHMLIHTALIRLFNPRDKTGRILYSKPVRPGISFT